MKGICGHEACQIPFLTAVAVVRFHVPVVHGVIFITTKIPERKPAPGDKDKRDTKGQGKTVVAVKGRAVLDEHRDKKEHTTDDIQEAGGFYRPGVTLVWRQT